MLRVDLHCHLDGSLTRSCIEELLGRSVSQEELQARDDCRSLKEYLEKFELPLEALQTEKALRRAGSDFMESAARDRLDYVEVRFSPLLSVRQGLRYEQVIEALLTGLEQGKERFGISYGVIACAMRGFPEEANLQMLKAAREFLGAGICAADLAGDEAAWPMGMFLELFEQVKRWEMPFTLHAGECGSVQNVVDAVECGAKRIGHGIALSGHPGAIELCRRQRIGIEMCPVSNRQTKAVAENAPYPMREFLDAGLLVTVNTDNRTVSGTDISRELQVIRDDYGIREEEIRQMMKNAAETSFADDSVKHRLLMLA